MNMRVIGCLFIAILGVVIQAYPQKPRPIPTPKPRFEARKALYGTNGSITLIGCAFAGAAVSVARLDSHGKLDPNFGDKGVAIVNFPNSNPMGCVDATSQSDGKILVTGWISTGKQMKEGFSDNDLFLLRLDLDGTLDEAFGIYGFVISTFGPEFSEMSNSVIVQRDGKIVAAGEVHDGRSNDFAVWRYLSNGQLDPEFGEAGKVKIAVTHGGDIVNRISERPDGKLIVAGRAFIGNDIRLLVVPLDSTGKIDELLEASKTLDFAADNSFVKINITSKGRPGNAAIPAELTGLVGPLATHGDFSAINQTGEIYVMGCGSKDYYQCAAMTISKLRADRTTDLSFGIKGKVVDRIPSNLVIGNTIALQPDGKILIIGRSIIAGQTLMAVKRYLANGQIDKAFGIEGRAVVSQ